MLVKHCYITTSLIPNAGLGLFAKESIKKGDIVWKDSLVSEKIYTQEEWDSLPSEFKLSITKYIYKNNNQYYLNLDDSRFMNHSENPSLIEDGNGNYIAAKDINVSDELTCNYKKFYDEEWLIFIMNF